MTWAGLHYDHALFVAGIVVLCAVAILWIWQWSFPQALGKRPEPPRLRYSEPPAEASAQEKAVFLIRQARNNAYVALANRSEDQARRVSNDLNSALLMAKKEIGIPIPEISGSGTYRQLLEVYILYIDSFFPLLRDGHIAEAKAAAARFKYQS